MNEEKEKELKRSEIDMVARPIVKLLIVACLPWVLISKLDKMFDQNSDEGFERWNFYWSFPATHLSWLTLTALFGLPLWGLIGAPVVLPVCVFRGVAHLSVFTSVIGAVIVAGIWIASYRAVQNYHSKREIREARRDVYREEADSNEA